MFVELTKGDKIILVKPTGLLDNVGEIYYVTNVSEAGVISFTSGNGLMTSLMSYDVFKGYFEKYEEPNDNDNTVITDRIEEIMELSKWDVRTVFDKCTVVSCQLPNGLVIVESSACVSPENYDEDMGFEICWDKIADKIWELEGYRLQEELYQEELYRESAKITDCDNCDGDCYGCYCDECHCVECNEDEEDERLDTDLDCDDCKDYSCEYNPNYTKYN